MRCVKLMKNGSRGRTLVNCVLVRSVGGKGILITVHGPVWFRKLFQLFPITSYSSSKSIPMAGTKRAFKNLYVWTRLGKFIDKWNYPFIVIFRITLKVYHLNKASQATVLHTFCEFSPLQTFIKADFLIKGKTCEFSPVLTDKLALH